MMAPEMEIQQEIERTREHLGDTVEELAARADMRTRVRAKATEMKDRAAEAAGQLRQRRLTSDGPAPGRHEAPRRWPFAAAAAGAVVVGSILVRRRRRKA
jgi:Protein of unknown function (DUF3618)